MPNRSRTFSTNPARMALAALLLTAAGCGVTDTDADATAEPADSEAVASFREQPLDFGSCEGKAPTANEAPFFVDPFQCAWMDVPLDYAHPDGEQAHIGLMKLAAKGGPDRKLGTIVVNPGGPGGSGMVQAAQAAAGLNGTEVTERFDIVGFDPRGVGASTPAISCFSDAQRDAGDDQTTLLGTSGSWSEDDTKKLAADCAEGSGGEEVLAHVGTRDAARDMDVLRDVLGEDKLTYMGQSYGTRLGTVFAEMFPDKVGAMVLDGVIDPNLGTAERRIELHAGFQRSFDKMAEFCASQAECPLGDDPAKATKRFQELVQPLVDHPVEGGGGRKVGFGQATGGVLGGLYYSDVWPGIIAGLRQLQDDGRGDKLLAIYDVYGTRAPSGEWNNQTEANLAINCNDEERLSPEEVADLRKRIVEVNPILDPGTDMDKGSRDACENWPGEPSLGYPYADDVEGVPGSLIVSITGDPVTPYPAGQALADSIGGRVLTVEGERHTTAMTGESPCVTAAVTDYLVDGRLPDEGARCRL